METRDIEGVIRNEKESHSWTRMLLRTRSYFENGSESTFDEDGVGKGLLGGGGLSR